MPALDLSARLALNLLNASGMDNQLEEIKRKYDGVFTLMQQAGVQLHNVNMSGSKLYVKGTAPSEQVKNQVWDKIKAVDSSYSDLTMDLDASAQAPPQTASAAAGSSQQTQTYTIQSGDTLSGISQSAYGNAGDYRKIMNANPEIVDADKIRAGQTIKIPA